MAVVIAAGRGGDLFGDLGFFGGDGELRRLGEFALCCECVCLFCFVVMVDWYVGYMIDLGFDSLVGPNVRNRLLQSPCISHSVVLFLLVTNLDTNSTSRPLLI